MLSTCFEIRSTRAGSVGHVNRRWTGGVTSDRRTKADSGIEEDTNSSLDGLQMVERQWKGFWGRSLRGHIRVSTEYGQKGFEDVLVEETRPVSVWR